MLLLSLMCFQLVYLVFILVSLNLAVLHVDGSMSGSLDVSTLLRYKVELPLFMFIFSTGK